MKKIFFVLLLFVCVFCSFAEKSTLFVTGIGKLSVPCKYAEINMSVVTRNKLAKKAVAENAEIISKVQKAFEKFNFESNAFSTSNYSVHRETVYDNEKHISIPADYKVSNDINLKVLVSENLGEIIDSAIDAGVNIFSGINFLPEENDNYILEAYSKAVENAQEIADAIAKTANVKIVKILEITHGENAGSQKKFKKQYNAAMEPPPAPLSATSILTKDLTISVSVNILFEIE